MLKTSLKLAAALAAGLVMVGCSHDEATAPPGPGPTAMPNTYRGSSIPDQGPINTESRMGSDHPMSSPPG